MQNSVNNPSFLRSSFLFNAIWSQVLNNHYNTSELSKIIGLKVLREGPDVCMELELTLK